MSKYTFATIVMTTALTLCGAGEALAQGAGNFDVVRDERGVIVHNTFGNCVRTRWISAKDACGAQPVQQVQQQKRTYIAKDERTVYFAFDKYNLTPEATQKLNNLSATLRSDQNVKQARIVGYADRLGDNAYNEKLSMNRADSVRKQLQQNGVVTAQKTEVRWLGETVPVTNCPDSLGRTKLIECLQKDRRVEVEVDYLPVAPQYPAQAQYPVQSQVPVQVQMPAQMQAPAQMQYPAQ